MANPKPPDGELRDAGADASAAFPPNAVDDPTGVCGTAKDAADWSGGVPPPPIVSPLIWIQIPIVLVKKPYTAKPTRQPVLLSTDQAFDGKGTFQVTSGAGNIRFFSKDAGGYEIQSGHVFSGEVLSLGTVIYAEGAKPSAAEKDVTLQLELIGGCKPVKPPVTSQMTSVEVTLDICRSRTKKDVDPDLLSTAQKIDPGRFIQVQDAGINAGRAMLIVRKANPASFTGTLVLAPKDARVRIFAAADDPPAAGQVALASPKKANADISAKGLKFWAEGVSASGALHDTGFKLGVDGVDPEGDIVNATAVQFAEIKATIKATPPNTPANSAAAGLALPADHVFKSSSLSRDFAVNAPLVLMRNAQPDIALQVTSAPPRLPILWQAIRNEADHGDLGGAKDVPKVTPDAADVKKAKLDASSKGSFRVRAFIDCNDTKKYEDIIDREPSIPLNLVLANATLVKDDSAANVGGGAGNLGTAVGATFININNGLWPAGAINAAALRQAAMGMKITADVTAGGGDGLLGIDKIFSGLVNMVQDRDVIGTYTDNTVAPPTVQHWRFIAASNAAAATGGAAPNKFFKPGDPAPVLYGLPLLDSGRRPPPPGTGGETATMSRSLAHTGAARPVGQRWTIQCVDSPGMSFPFTHPANVNAMLAQIHYHYEFTACFCFWTNITKNRSATGDPADRVYSVLRIVKWRIVGDWSVAFGGAPPVPALTVTTPHKVSVPSRRTILPIGRAQDNGVEVRGPSGIQIAVWDGST